MGKFEEEAKALSLKLYEVLIEKAGWHHSPAHDGWISDDYMDDFGEGPDRYEPFSTAEEVCFCCGVTGGDEAIKLAASAERNARNLDEATIALRSVYEWQAGSTVLPTEIWEQLRSAISKAQAS